MMLSVVIPAYNEANGIAAIADRVLSIKKELAEVGVDELELVVVDDASTDATFQIAEDHGARVIRHQVNRGYGRALKTGFAAAKGDLLGFLDADGTYPPEYYPALCKGVLDGGEVVVGSRRSGAMSQMPMVRKIGNFLWSHLIGYLTNHPVTDPASGMRVFKKETLTGLYPLPDGLNFTPVMSTRAVNEGVNLVHIPIPYSERVGRSKLGVVSDGFLFLSSIILTAMSYKPGRVIGKLAAVMMAVGIFLGVVLAGLFAAGLQISLGLLGSVGVLTVIPLSLGLALLVSGMFFSRRVTSESESAKPGGDDTRTRGKSAVGIALGAMGLISLGIAVAMTTMGTPLFQLWPHLLSGALLLFLGVQLSMLKLRTVIAYQLGHREHLRNLDVNATA